MFQCTTPIENIVCGVQQASVLESFLFNLSHNDILKILFFSLFYPHIDYCCEVWGHIYKTNIYCTYISKKNSLFSRMNIFKLKEIVKYKSYMIDFNAFNNVALCIEFVF